MASGVGASACTAAMAALESVGSEPPGTERLLDQRRSAAEAEAIFAGLSAGGEVQMPLSRTAWAELNGTLRDRFGVLWMVSYTGGVDFQG